MSSTSASVMVLYIVIKTGIKITIMPQPLTNVPSQIKLLLYNYTDNRTSVVVGVHLGMLVPSSNSSFYNYKLDSHDVLEATP